MVDDKRQLGLFSGEADDEQPRPPPISVNETRFGLGADWTAVAERAVLTVAKRRRFFTTDEVWATGLEPPAEPRALGAVLKRAAGFGFIERTDRFRATRRRSRRGAPVAIWRSLLKPAVKE